MSTIPQPSRTTGTPTTGPTSSISASKSRRSFPAPSDASRAQFQPSVKPRTPSSPKLPLGNKSPLSHSASSASASRSVSGTRAPSSPEKSLRRTISIAAFPQPPRAASRPSASSSLSGNQSLPSSGSVRVKRGSRLSVGTTSSYRSSKTPSLLNGGADGKAILSAEIRDPEASPSQSRSSSAQGSYSTSATTFEDADDAAGMSKSDSKPKEAKGNVIVSVRVRPDVNGNDPSKASGDWTLDARRSLISYQGKEGGDYYYGRATLHRANLCPDSTCCADLYAFCLWQIMSSPAMNTTPRCTILRQNALCEE